MASNDQSSLSAATPAWIAPSPGQRHAHIATNGNNLLKTGAGALLGVSINTGGTTSTATVYDGTDNTGALLGVIDTTKQNVLPIAWAVATGLFVVTAGGVAADITVLYV